MKDSCFIILILIALGVEQFLVVPIFSNQALGGKVVFFSLFVIALALCMVWQRREWLLPWPLIPLIFLFVTFLVSQSRSIMPGIGVVELGTLAIGLLFSALVANLAYEGDGFIKWVFKWLQIVGAIVGVLCLYQYFYWVLLGPSKHVLIPYLLPPGNGGRVNGVFGQANLTALLLVLAIIAYLYSYVSKKDLNYTRRGLWRDIGFLFVSTAFFLTGSRAGLVAFFAIVAVLLLLVVKRKLAFSRNSSIRPILIMLAGYIFSLLPLSSEITSSIFVREAVSVEARFLFWTASFLIFLDSPFLGVGLDHFKLFLPSYARKAHDVLGFVQYDAMAYTNWSHNEYLQILAESGIFGALFLAIFCIMLIRIMYKDVFQNKPYTERSFSLLLILPFFIQSMFSWPFRHPALLFIFFLLLGIILSKSSGLKLYLRPIASGFLTVFLAFCVVGIGFFAVKEHRFVQLKKDAIEEGCETDRITNAMNDPFMRFKVLREVLPLCIADESSFEDRSLMEGLKPCFMEISSLQGTHSQWYNLGLIYRNLGEYAQAEQAFQKAVERQPEFELGWAALHALHIEEAVRQTGRPIQDFLPPDKQFSADYYDSLFKRQ